MHKAVVAVLLLGVLFGPATCLVGIAVLLNPAAQASCLAATGLNLGAVPTALTVTGTAGSNLRLSREQLERAATIIETGSRIPGVGRKGLVIALMAGLAESRLQMLSNTDAFPESGTFPNDGDGSDHDSLGIFQMRPSAGWGTVEDLMDAAFQTRAFFGGPSGPNHGSPRGLLDLPNWHEFDEGVAAQAVEVSAHPDRYAPFKSTAERIIAVLTTGDSYKQGADAEIAETTSVVFPQPDRVGIRTSRFGMRDDPVTGKKRLHTGIDFAAPSGTPILAVADGEVFFAGKADGYGHIILINHTIDGQQVSSGYAHMFGDQIYVEHGDHVTAGQHIADIGTSGNTTGPHLHFEIRPGGGWSDPIDPEPWFNSQGAAVLDGASTDATGCLT